MPGPRLVAAAAPNTSASAHLAPLPEQPVAGTCAGCWHLRVLLRTCKGGHLLVSKRLHLSSARLVRGPG